MLCVKCKAELPEGAAFCPYCGKRQEPTRRYRKRSNGSGSICKLSGNRKKPWAARKSGVLIGTYETRGEAQKALDRLVDREIPDSYNMTFSEVYQRWQAEHSREVSQKMADGYALAYKHCPALHDMKMRKILKSDYQAAIIALEQQGMSKSSCQKLRVLLGMLGAWAKDEGITLTNNAQGLTTAAKQKKQRNCFPENKIDHIRRIAMDSGPNSNAARLTLILISCGCRPGEFFSAPLLNCRPDHIIWGSKTEAGRDRVIPIGPDGIRWYTEMRDRAIREGAQLLISGYEGANKTAPNFTKREWRQLMEEIDCPGWVPYDCRHTFITRAIRSGVDLPHLEAIVGHIDRDTTKIYTHLRAGDLVQEVQKMAGVKNAVCNKCVTRSDNNKRNTA